MGDNTLFIIVAITALAAVVVLMYMAGRGLSRKRITPLGGLAFACIVAGFVFHRESVLGYGLLGAGVILAVIDVLERFKGTEK